MYNNINSNCTVMVKSFAIDEKFECPQNCLCELVNLQ